MSKVLVLFLITALLVPMSGCVAKPEHEKLIEEKAVFEKKCDELLVKEEELRAEIAARQEDIRSLREELKSAKEEIRNLDMEISRLKAAPEGFKK